MSGWTAPSFPAGGQAHADASGLAKDQLNAVLFNEYERVQAEAFARVQDGGRTGASVVAQAALPVGDLAYDIVEITGNTGITSLSTPASGYAVRTLRFSGTPLVTHSSVLILPDAANIQVAAGDVAKFYYAGSSVWRCVSYQRAAATLDLAYLAGGLFIKDADSNPGSEVVGNYTIRHTSSSRANVMIPNPTVVGGARYALAGYSAAYNLPWAGDGFLYDMRIYKTLYASGGNVAVDFWNPPSVNGWNFNRRTFPTPLSTAAGQHYWLFTGSIYDGQDSDLNVLMFHWIREA